MILITGATGHLGTATIDHLLKRIPANEIAALVRDEQKAAALKAKGIEIRRGNYDDKSSLVSAFKNIDKLFFISGSDVENRLPQHRNIVQAAMEAGVKHIIYTSFTRKNETNSNPLGILATGHIETDRMIIESGIPYTIMLNSLYMDVLPLFFGPQVLETGIFLPAGEGKTGFVKRDDIAKAAAAILSGKGHEGKRYVISNTEAYSFGDAAKLLSGISGKHVTYTSPSADSFRQVLTGAGVPAAAIDITAAFSEGIRQGEFETASTDLEKLLGARPATLKEFLQETYSSQQQ